MELKNSNEQLEEILSSLDLPSVSRKIYITLLGSSRSFSARAIAEILDIPRPSVYDHLEILQGKNLIIPKKQDGKLFFSANSPHHIQALIDTQESRYREMKRTFGNLLPRLGTTKGGIEPKVQFFNGLEGFKYALGEILWHRQSETYAVWPTQKIKDLLGPVFMGWHDKRRVEEQISTTVILPESETSMCYWIYGDKVAFFDSSEELSEPCGFIVHSKAFSKMMKINFDLNSANRKILLTDSPMSKQ